ncbi:MAG TPA: hypothetical protein VGN26_22510 [Armatimonadota bacterium]|jgi:hypothetical protein
MRSLTIGVLLVLTLAGEHRVTAQDTSLELPETVTVSPTEQIELTSATLLRADLEPREALYRRVTAKGVENLPATLTCTQYGGTETRAEQGQEVRSPFSRLICYELKVKGLSSYGWAVWNEMPLHGFRLFNTAKGGNYLAWIYARSVCIAEVSKPRSQREALKGSWRTMPPTGAEKVPVVDMLGSQRFPSFPLSYFDIRIQSVDVDVKGRLRL